MTLQLMITTQRLFHAMNSTKLSHWHSFMSGPISAVASIKQLYDSVQEEYINNYLKENVPKNDQKKFVADLQHDLNTLASDI